MDVGSIVQANTTVLVTINRIAPIYVSFSPAGAEPRRRETIPGGRRSEDPGHPARGGERTCIGTLTFIDNTVDSTTGTFALKGTFTNADRRLWPGQYVNVTLTVTTQSDAIVVPTGAAVGTEWPVCFCRQGGP